MIKAVVFDCDGTLYSKTELSLRFVLRYPLHLKSLRRFFRVRNTLRAHRNIRHEQFRTLSQIENRGYEDTKFYYEDLIYNKLFSLTPKVKTKVKSTIKTLRERGYTLGILTEFPYEIKLKKMGLHESDFEIIINLEDYGILKPQKEGFSMLIRRSNLRPDEIVYVGDRLDTDVMGANGTGIRSCIVSRRKVKQADYTIKCLPDIMSVVERVS